MAFKCLDCGAVFDEPELRSYTENLDGEHGYWTYHYMVCPKCHSDEVEEADDVTEEEF